MKNIQKMLPLKHEDVVFVRVDFNLPKTDSGYDTYRVLQAKDTIQVLYKQGAHVVLITHFGRPEKKSKHQDHLSTRNLISDVSCILESPIVFMSIDEFLQTPRSSLPRMVMLENIRFYLEETTKDKDVLMQFAKLLSNKADYFVNEAFAVSHRNHASIVGLPAYLPSYAGINFIHEIQQLNQHIKQKNSLTCMSIVGGSKISTKIHLLKTLINYSKTIFIGGAMAHTFMIAKGIPIGKSLYEKEYIPVAKEFLQYADAQKCKIILPCDFVLSDTRVVYELHAEDQALDCGPDSLSLLIKLLQDQTQVLWNGPLGYFEKHPFDISSITLAMYIANWTDVDHISIAGGGDTVTVLQKAHVLEKFTFVSTGGGAFLKWLDHKTLPGIDALSL